MIVGVDTSLGTAVSVIDPTGVRRSEITHPGARGHVEHIAVMLDQALADAGVSDVQTVSVVAAGMGPGPFTGLRVGIATARAFAFARAVPFVPVLSHDAIAIDAMYKSIFTSEQTFAVVTDAGRKQFAYTIYQGWDADGIPKRIFGPALCDYGAISQQLEPFSAERYDANAVPAAMIAMLGLNATVRHRVIAADQPVYLRAPDATPPQSAAS